MPIRTAAGRRRLLLWLCAAAGLASIRLVSGANAQGPIVLTDVTGRTGIAFKHTDGSSGRRYIVEYVSAGLAVFDYDRDGDEDVYFVNGAPLQGAEADVPPTNALYRNEGNWQFTDVTRQAGVGDTGFGLGAAAGDYDNDGDLDLYVNNFGPNVLYRNNGDGTFTDVTRQAGVGNGSKVGAGVCFLDMEGDGDLDLYVGNYIQFSYEMHIPRTRRGVSFYRSPREYPAEPDTLYRNNGDGTFTDVSMASGVGAHVGMCMGMVCADYDNDGDTDIFVGNDVSENFFFRNDGSGKFEEVGLFVGAAFDVAGVPQGTMGIDCGDYDNNGWLDFFSTSYAHETTVLYRNSGEGFVEDVTAVAGANAGTIPPVTWGDGFVDFDNDGDRDIFVSCGHFDPNAELIDDTAIYRTPNILLMNTGDGRFVNVSESSGDGMLVRASGRGAAFDDLDGDGDVDVVVLNSRDGPTLLRNDSNTANHWLQIRLRGVKTNRDGVGAHVKLTAGDLVQLDEVHSGRSYQSHYGMRLHFGLGRRDHVDRIEVRWIGGAVDVLENVEADQLLVIAEGSGRAAE